MAVRSMAIIPITHTKSLAKLKAPTTNIPTAQIMAGVSGIMFTAPKYINTKLKLIQDSIRENMRRWLENPESHNIKDISKVGIGTYVPRKVSQGWTWDFNALGEEAYENSPYAGGTALESEPPEESEETVEEMPDWLL